MARVSTLLVLQEERNACAAGIFMTVVPNDTSGADSLTWNRYRRLEGDHTLRRDQQSYQSWNSKCTRSNPCEMKHAKLMYNARDI